jgi:hypothetical protein
MMAVFSRWNDVEKRYSTQTSFTAGSNAALDGTARRTTCSGIKNAYIITRWAGSADFVETTK